MATRASAEDRETTDGTDECRAALWTLVGVFVVFKIATTMLILLAAPSGAWTTVWLFIAFHWPLAVAGVLLAVTPLLFWLRLVRVRMKRSRLEAAEWRLD